MLFIIEKQGLILIDDKKTLHDGINRIGYLRVFLNRLIVIVDSLQNYPALVRLVVLLIPSQAFRLGYIWSELTIFYRVIIEYGAKIAFQAA